MTGSQSLGKRKKITEEKVNCSIGNIYFQITMAENVHKVFFSEIGDKVSFYRLDKAHQIWRKVTAEEPSFGDGDRLGDSPEFPL